MPSEKCAVIWGSYDDGMRMITASFVRAIERFAGNLCLHFLPLFQQVVAIRKTCNQLHVMLALCHSSRQVVINCLQVFSDLHNLLK